MKRDDVWARALSAAGAIGAAVAIVYVIGATSLSLRYEGFGLPGQQAAGLTPREVLLAAGLRTLAIWAILGVASVFVVRALPAATVRAVVSRLGTPAGVVVVVALGLALLLLLRVWWPLAALLGLLAIALASVFWASQPLRQLLVSVLAVGLVAVAYEADRITYVLEWTCVDLARVGDANRVNPVEGHFDPRESGRRVCGTLVGQQDRGFYLGVPDGANPTQEAYRLTFIPAARVEAAYSQRRMARVVATRADQRREPLLSRLLNVRVR